MWRREGRKAKGREWRQEGGEWKCPWGVHGEGTITLPWTEGAQVRVTSIILWFYDYILSTGQVCAFPARMEVASEGKGVALLPLEQEGLKARGRSWSLAGCWSPLALLLSPSPFPPTSFIKLLITGGTFPRLQTQEAAPSPQSCRDTAWTFPSPSSPKKKCLNMLSMHCDRKNLQSLEKLDKMWKEIWTEEMKIACHDH